MTAYTGDCVRGGTAQKSLRWTASQMPASSILKICRRSTLMSGVYWETPEWKME